MQVGHGPLAANADSQSVMGPCAYSWRSLRSSLSQKRMDDCNENLVLAYTAQQINCFSNIHPEDAFGSTYDVVKNDNKININYPFVGVENSFQVRQSHIDPDARVFGRLANGKRIVFGALAHSVYVNRSTVGLLAYLAAPNGTVIDLKQSILLPQCKLSTSISCSENTEPAFGRVGLNKNSMTGGSSTGRHTATDRYWANFLSNAQLDMNSPNNRPGRTEKYYQGSPAIFPLNSLTPALETYVPLCSDTSVSLHSTNCLNSPINNYYSPVVRFPRLVEVPVTPQTRLAPRRFRSSNGAVWRATSAPMVLKSYDYDGHMMTPYDAAYAGGDARNTSVRCWMGMLSLS